MAHASQITRGLGDTIVAVSTPRGSGGRGVVRLSGNSAIELAGAGFERAVDCLKPTDLDWQATDGRMVVGRSGVSTPVSLWVMRGPRSYTGEDMVELHLPGSPTLLSMVVEIMRRRGARQALPGEFTQRAFLNGRIDLTRAEAVAAAIHAHSEHERKAAMGILGGERARLIRGLGDKVADLLAAVELDLDFSDQDIEIVEPAGFSSALVRLAEELEGLAAAPGVERRTLGRRRIVLAGPANAGKSSLFNALTGREAAIVSRTEGTTRDFLEAELEIDGTHVILVDTAGDDFTASPIDTQAHRLREQAKSESDFIIPVRSGLDLIDLPPTGTVLISHADAVASVRRPESDERLLWFSSQTGEGLDAVGHLLAKLVRADQKGADQALEHLDQRHREGFAASAEAVRRASEAQGAQLGYELVAADLHDARHHLRVLTGDEYTDEILDRIMRDFCIGK